MLSAVCAATWDSYVQDVLLGSGYVRQAGILEHSGGHLAKSVGFQINTKEFEHIIASMRVPDLGYKHGIWIGGHHFRVRLADGQHGILGKDSDDGLRGCSVCKTRKLLIIGLHDQSSTSVQCNEVVMNLGDFFRQKDW